MQTDLPDSLWFESDRTDRNFELSYFRIDYSSSHPPYTLHPLKRKIYVETLKNRQKHNQSDCSEEEEIFATYLKQEKF